MNNIKQIMACKVCFYLKPVFILTFNKFIHKVKIVKLPYIEHPLPIAYPPIRSVNSLASASYDERIHSSKYQVISKLNFEHTEHAKPFYELPVKTLIHIYKVTQNDVKQRHCSNRLYYLSDKLKCSPSVVSKHIVKRTFIYSLTFEWLKETLDVLLGKKATLCLFNIKDDDQKYMGITSEGLLRDLWVLKYSSSTIQERLQNVRNMGVETLHPWMVRCSEDILKRYIEIMQETKNILGETKSTQVYLARRLNTTTETVNQMCLKTPALKTIRVTKVKNFLDYLLGEGFAVDDIANKPRILAASQKTIKQRIEKLKQLGVEHVNLNILCRSKKHFKKYCDSLESISNKSSQ